MLDGRGGKFIEQLVQADEGGSANIPMCLLDPGKQVEQVGDHQIQGLHRLSADGGFKCVASFVHNFHELVCNRLIGLLVDP